MLYHYLKIAFRNLLKYKAQNIISIIGLAVGFTCFAFSTLWIRYEMSYDSFHPKADRIYRVNVAPFKWDAMGGGDSEIQPGSYILGTWLKTNFPEIEEACAIRIVTSDNVGLGTDYSILYYDQYFCKIFDMPFPETLLIEGQTDRPVAVIPEFDNEETVTNIKETLDFDVQATMPRWPANTNIQFNIAASMPAINYPAAMLTNWNTPFETFILVKEGVDLEVLGKKLYKIDIPEWKQIPISLVLTPIKQLRYKDPTGRIKPDVKLSHIQIFTIAGLLVILCALFNHLTLFVTRVQMRMRELAMRKVNGASDPQIAATLYTDFMLVILLSLVTGFALMIGLLPTYKEYASIGNTNVSIYTELLTYAILLIVCGFIACGIPFFYFRKQVLNESIRGSVSPGSRNLFRKGSLLVQLIISLGMIFCTSVFIKQIRFLHQTGLGINRHNIATFEPSWRASPSYPLQYIDRIKQIPGIIDAIPVRGGAFLRNMAVTSISSIGSFRTAVIEKDGQRINYTYFISYADPRFFDFFGVEIIEGMRFSNENNNKLVINETMKNDLGKDFVSAELDIIGVAQDFYLTPTAKAKPIAILYPDERQFTTIAYKYEEGFRQQIELATDKFLREEFPDHGGRVVWRHYMEDIFEEHIKSERALLKLLSVMTLACILIAIFGVYSLTSLTCEQRRKEIAIRKINGAGVLDIMNIFFKEYLILLALAAIVAFPSGYIIMKGWLESYVKQTSMDAWLYVLIFLTVFLVIIFSIVSMVWKAANQNPAEVVKRE